jgi:hypothetical protein
LPHDHRERNFLSNRNGEVGSAPPPRTSPAPGLLAVPRLLPVIVLISLFSALFAACESEADRTRSRLLDEVRIDLSALEGRTAIGEERGGLDAALHALDEVLRRWRILHPRARLPDLRLIPALPDGGDSDGDEDGGAPGELVVPVVLAGGEASRGTALAELRTQVVTRLARLETARPPLLPAPFPHFAPGRSTNLERAVRAGAADLLAELAAGRHPAPELYDWAVAREEALWDAFRPEREGTRPPRWGDDPDDTPAPGDPARYLGYRIALSFWERSPNRRLAVEELVELRDAGEFLERSGYDGPASTPHLPPSLRGLPLSNWPGFDCATVALGGARLRVCTGGEGSVPLLLEAAGEADMRLRHRLAPVLAEEFHVVTYDRAGMGGSEPTDTPRTPDRLAHELAAALEVAAGPGPYLVAGTNAAAPALEAFRSLYPWRVADVVRMEAPAEVAGDALRRSLSDAPLRLQSQISAGMAGEPTGCWRMAPPLDLPEPPPAPFRLGFLASGASDDASGTHPLLSPLGREIGGRWRPEGRDRIHLLLGPAGGATLNRTGDGGWRGALTLPGGATQPLTLLETPCGLPT